MTTQPLRGFRARLPTEPRWLRPFLAWDWNGAGDALTVNICGHWIATVHVPYLRGPQ